MKKFSGSLIEVLWDCFMWIRENEMDEKIKSAYLYKENNWYLIVHFEEDARH